MGIGEAGRGEDGRNRNADIHHGGLAAGERKDGTEAESEGSVAVQGLKPMRGFAGRGGPGGGSRILIIF
jgi:hypothetical protein